MCSQYDDPTTYDRAEARPASQVIDPAYGDPKKVTMTEAQGEAFRAYMIDLDAQCAAMLANVEHDTPEYADYREGFGLGVEHLYGNRAQVLPEGRSRIYYKGYEDGNTPSDVPCPACGYVESDTGATQADNAHDNLCCGTTECSMPGECETHR